MTEWTIKAYDRKRERLMNSTKPDVWTSVDDSLPLLTGLYFTKTKDFVGEITLTEYLPLKSGGYWSTGYPPTHWALPKQK